MNLNRKNSCKQAGAELRQAQIKLDLPEPANLLSECSSTKNDAIATTIICLAQNAIQDVRRSMQNRPELQAAVTNRVSIYREICRRSQTKDLLPPSFAHKMLTDMATNKALQLKYNTISQETYMLTKKAIPTLLADEAAGNMLEEYNKLHKNKRSKVKEVMLHDKAENDLLDNIKRIERGFFSLGH